MADNPENPLGPWSQDDLSASQILPGSAHTPPVATETNLADSPRTQDSDESHPSFPHYYCIGPDHTLIRPASRLCYPREDAMNPLGATNVPSESASTDSQPASSQSSGPYDPPAWLHLHPRPDHMAVTSSPSLSASPRNSAASSISQSAHSGVDGAVSTHGLDHLAEDRCFMDPISPRSSIDETADSDTIMASLRHSLARSREELNSYADIETHPSIWYRIGIERRDGTGLRRSASDSQLASAAGLSSITDVTSSANLSTSIASHLVSSTESTLPGTEVASVCTCTTFCSSPSSPTLSIWHRLQPLDAKPRASPFLTAMAPGARARLIDTHRNLHIDPASTRHRHRLADAQDTQPVPDRTLSDIPPEANQVVTKSPSAPEPRGADRFSDFGRPPRPRPGPWWHGNPAEAPTEVTNPHTPI